MLCKIFSKLFACKCQKPKDEVKAEVDQLDSNFDTDLKGDDREEKQT